VEALPPTVEIKLLLALVKELVIGTAFTLALTRTPEAFRPTIWHIAFRVFATAGMTTRLLWLPLTLEDRLLLPLDKLFAALVVTRFPEVSNPRAWVMVPATGVRQAWHPLTLETIWLLAAVKLFVIELELILA